jgi:hypothetical protein
MFILSLIERFFGKSNKSKDDALIKNIKKEINKKKEKKKITYKGDSR